MDIIGPHAFSSLAFCLHHLSTHRYRVVDAARQVLSEGAPGREAAQHAAHPVAWPDWALEVRQAVDALPSATAAPGEHAHRDVVADWLDQFLVRPSRVLVQSFDGNTRDTAWQSVETVVRLLRWMGEQDPDVCLAIAHVRPAVRVLQSQPSPVLDVGMWRQTRDCCFAGAQASPHANKLSDAAIQHLSAQIASIPGGPVRTACVAALAALFPQSGNQGFWDRPDMHPIVLACLADLVDTMDAASHSRGQQPANQPRSMTPRPATARHRTHPGDPNAWASLQKKRLLRKIATQGHNGRKDEEQFITELVAANAGSKRETWQRYIRDLDNFFQGRNQRIRTGGQICPDTEVITALRNILNLS